MNEWISLAIHISLGGYYDAPTTATKPMLPFNICVLCCIFTAGQLPHIPPMRGTYTPCRSIQLASYLSISVRQQTLTTTMTDWMNEWPQNVMTRQQSQHSRVDIAFRYLAMQQQTPKFIWLTNPTSDRARRHRRVNGHILNTMHEKTPGYSRLLRD